MPRVLKLLNVLLQPDSPHKQLIYLTSLHSLCQNTKNFLSYFINNNINQSQIDIVCSVEKKIDDYFYILEEKYRDVNFYFYQDTRTDFTYISSVRPHILKKHFEKYPDLYKGSFLYHDCDIALTQELDLDKYLCTCNDNCYLSDTRSYIGYNYIMEKGEAVLNRMIQTIDIDRELVKANQDNSGGAQYLLKNIDYKFWEQVEIDCVQLYKNITSVNAKIKGLNPEYHELQIWCSDMWNNTNYKRIKFYVCSRWN